MSPFSQNFSDVLEDVLLPFVDLRNFRSFKTHEHHQDTHRNDQEKTNVIAALFDEHFNLTTEDKIDFLKAVSFL